TAASNAVCETQISPDDLAFYSQLGQQGMARTAAGESALSVTGDNAKGCALGVAGFVTGTSMAYRISEAQVAQAYGDIDSATMTDRMGGAAGEQAAWTFGSLGIAKGNAAWKGQSRGATGLREGDVMPYEKYLEVRQRGSSLRGHHIPQQQRLRARGIDPRRGTVLVVENARHTQTRTYGSRGRTTAAQEAGVPLRVSETRCINDPPVRSLGRGVGRRVKTLNRKNFPEEFK
ncbi:MAG: hypothetical protein GY854_26960, partial [Deltaproteobacteria bacterium]|nr:hypothetical protein [Deltaproteobacteria bacterium]